MSRTSPADRFMFVRLKAALLGVVGSFVLFASYLAIPPLGIFSGILAPFPGAYNRVVHGRGASLIVILGTTAAVTALFGIFAGGLYLGMCAIISFFMPELLLRGMGAGRTLFWTTVANLLVFGTVFIVYSSVSGINIQQLISAEISGSLKQAIAIYEKGGVTGEELALLKRSMATAADLLQRLYPMLVTTLFIAIAGCNLILVKKTTAKTVDLAIGDFNTFRNPEPLVWGLIASGFLLLLPPSPVATPALNLLLIIVLLYFLQGMAVIFAFITRYSVPVLVRILLYTMLIIQPYLLALVAAIGLFDLWVDFRTPKPQENL